MQIDNPFLVSRAAKRSFLEALQQFSSQTQSPAPKKVSIELIATNTICIEVNKVFVHYVSSIKWCFLSVIRYSCMFLSVGYQYFLNVRLKELLNRHFSGFRAFLSASLICLINWHFSGPWAFLSASPLCFTTCLWAHLIFLGEWPNCIQRHLWHLGTGTSQGS